MWSVVASLIFISVFAAPSIVAHVAAGDPEQRQKWEKLLRVIYIIYIVSFALPGIHCLIKYPDEHWYAGVNLGFSFIAFLCLFRPFRALLPFPLTVLNKLASLSFIVDCFRKAKTKENLAEKAEAGKGDAEKATEPSAFHDASMLKRIFLPDSLPHLNGLVLYLLSLAYTLLRVNLDGFDSPALKGPPEFRQINMVFAGEFLATLLVIACGLGLFVSRKPKEILRRLSVVKPGKKEFALGISLCLLTFAYDYVWSLFTHSSQNMGSYQSVMRSFNEGTYLGQGDLGGALIVALAIAVVAGVEEEVTNRGALQPVLGIVPAAFLHAALHSQFDSAPLFMIQIFGWSALMGTVKYYTNTTTTMIAHGLFNFISCFLIGFNP